MNELVTLVLGVVFGIAGCWRRMSATTLLISAVTLGVTATVLSGEYTVSRVYLLLDIGQAALGVLLGSALFRLLPKPAPNSNGPHAGTLP